MPLITSVKEKFKAKGSVAISTKSLELVALNLTPHLCNCGLRIHKITPIRDCKWNRDLHLGGYKESCGSAEFCLLLTTVHSKDAECHIHFR